MPLTTVLRAFFIFFFSLVILTACQTPKKQASLASIALQVKTRASSYIYFSPIPVEQRTIYITTQDDADSDAVPIIKNWMTHRLTQLDFMVVNNLDQANIALRINTLRLGKINNDLAPALLESEFGNSTPLFDRYPSMESALPTPNNTALVLDLQYFERKKLVHPDDVTARSSMTQLSDRQFLLLCNTTRWERFQTRIVSVVFNPPPTSSSAEVLDTLSSTAAQANAEIIRGLSY